MLFVARDVFPLLGSGEEKAPEMDRLASRRFDALAEVALRNGYPLSVVAFEGERDGINASVLQDMDNSPIPEGRLVVAVDPIDGTLAGARGASRCLSVLAAGTTNRVIKRVPDGLSCFYVASRDDPYFLTHLHSDGFRIGRWREIGASRGGVIGTLRRNESDELWRNILGSDCFLGKSEIGDRDYYLPNLLTDKIFFAGDGSLSLFYETDAFIGRTGAAEAVIESRLWSHWRGLLVSGNMIKRYSGGQIRYYHDRIAAAHDGGIASRFFLTSEIDELYRNGWTEIEILSPLAPNDFSPPFRHFVLGSLTGTRDSVLSRHSKNNLNRLELKADGSEGCMHFMHVDICDDIRSETFRCEHFDMVQ